MPALKSKPKTGLGKKLSGVKKPEKREPLWKGPEDDGPLGGITQSMLNAFCGCRARFFTKYVEGLQPVQGFNRVIEYGNMWHTAEEHFAANEDWQKPLTTYCQELCRKYPLAQDDINKWYLVCMTQFPLYADWWSKHKDVTHRTPLMQESVFHVAYTLPSGRVVYLRGKFDSVDLLEEGTKRRRVSLKENKSKSDIDELRMQRQLKMDLQTLIYTIALQEMIKRDGLLVGSSAKKSDFTHDPNIVKEVSYNVVRRPLSGGRGSITQGKGSDGSVCSGCDGKGERTMYAGTKREVFEKPCSKCEGKGRTGMKPAETDEEFQGRLQGIIEGAVGQEWGMPDGQHFFFQRWTVAISPTDIERFKTRFLNPILQQLCEWYDWVAQDVANPFGSCIHYQLPFGLYNPLVENGFSDLDEYLMDGNDAGLVRQTTLFTELQ